ncbi:NB-ARC domain-containing protein [Streptomyces sp. NPDC093510]|uniref:NB-ARC domain-containing protein n=1 Tax=Streptomyces sp. NPDC093510 TaxID=3155199 RepID=UPI003421F112
MLVAAVAGLAGVGKTELVVQSAVRALKKPGWFPGGVLFVDMFGYDPERHLSPERALDGLLRALGMPREHIPAGLQDRSRLYRSVLAAFAEQGQRILVVIDNASTAEQARPLLPTDGTTATLLTSRHTLDIDARLHDMNTLDPHASVELLHQVLLQARGTTDTRVQDAPEDATTIARLCAGLPLALRIAAACSPTPPPAPWPPSPRNWTRRTPG